MSMFGDDDPLDDAALIKAARKRILRQLDAEQTGGGANSVINNYGGGGGGLMERMNGGGEAEDPGLYDYLVDIERRDLPEINPDTKKPVGWTKKVHRHREEKKK